VIGPEDSIAVGLLDGEPPEGALADGQGEGVSGALERLRLVGPGQQRLASTLDVEDELAVDEHDQGAGLASRLVPALGDTDRGVVTLGVGTVALAVAAR
jgi:hypothetical protein